MRAPAPAPEKNDEIKPVGMRGASARNPIGSGVAIGGALEADNVIGTSDSDTNTDTTMNRVNPEVSSTLSRS